MRIENDLFIIGIPADENALWTYTLKQTNITLKYAAPVFEVDGTNLNCPVNYIKAAAQPLTLPNGCTEYRLEGIYSCEGNIRLQIIFRIAEDSPIVRFRYILGSDINHKLTKSEGKDNIKYLSTSLKGFDEVKEIRFSEFNDMTHSFCLSERQIPASFFENRLSLMGPMIIGSDNISSIVMAYEHGSQVPDAYVSFELEPNYAVVVGAVKGNYYNGYEINAKQSYETIWFQTGAAAGSEAVLAEVYRSFVLKYMSINTESRKPYIYYNTWAFQERNKWWKGNKYLDSMRLERILAEIDAAHKIGIDVFVIDTGWYEKTGDWKVSLERFPDGLKAIKAKLDSYGMKLGLWFNPLAAALTSDMLQRNKECITSLDGKLQVPRAIWETEESYHLCLASKYSDDFANQLIRIASELGVTYFKWDAIDQYGCNSPDHYHGNEDNSAQERADCYSFQLGTAMQKIVEKLCQACPRAIVDFDITEGNRYVGLGFLAAGKYFLINNGPYFFNYDLKIDLERENWNLFFNPGPARSWICRTPLNFDKWIPSVLFLTHYLPDDPYKNQIISLASLILGQNGIWGDLLDISPDGISLLGRILGLYKQIRDHITDSFPVRWGEVGGSPEIHEKISKATGKGAIVAFSNSPGKYSYVSTNKVVSGFWKTEGAQVNIDSIGKARIEVEFTGPGAHIILFGVESSNN